MPPPTPAPINSGGTAPPQATLAPIGGIPVPPPTPAPINGGGTAPPQPTPAPNGSDECVISGSKCDSLERTTNTSCVGTDPDAYLPTSNVVGFNDTLDGTLAAWESVDYV